MLLLRYWHFLNCTFYSSWAKVSNKSKSPRKQEPRKIWMLCPLAVACNDWMLLLGRRYDVGVQVGELDNIVCWGDCDWMLLLGRRYGVGVQVGEWNKIMYVCVCVFVCGIVSHFLVYSGEFLFYNLASYICRKLFNSGVAEDVCMIPLYSNY